MIFNSSNKPTSKQIATALQATLVTGTLAISGCASTIAKVTGSNQVGVMAGDRTISQRLRDSGIEKNALVNLYKLDKRFKSHSRVNVAAFHDAVLITGQVPDMHLKNLATDNVRAIREVKAVHNELEVAPQASYTEIIDDGVIKASIRKNLLLMPGLKDSRVKVEVERGVVYLMGVLSDEEVRKVLATVQQTGGIKKIISLVDRLEDVEKQMEKRIAQRKTASATPASKQSLVVEKRSMSKAAAPSTQNSTKSTQHQSTQHQSNSQVKTYKLDPTPQAVEKVVEQPAKSGGALLETQP